LLLSLITIGTIIASSVCFVLAKQNEHKRLNKIKPLTYGIIIAITSLILFMIVCVAYYRLRNRYNWMSSVLRTIRLDRRIWQYQVDSFQNTEEGLIVDEFIAFRYEKIIMLRVDLINNVMQTGWILRVFLVTRDK
jgi:hypothetical protein